MLGEGFASRPQQRMAQANRSTDPSPAGNRATVGEKIHERMEERPLNRRTVLVKNSDNPAQSVPLPSLGHVLNSRGVLSCQ